jgi:predicted GIY-YIG superfamily endonuclease
MTRRRRPWKSAATVTVLAWGMLASKTSPAAATVVFAAVSALAVGCLVMARAPRPPRQVRPRSYGRPVAAVPERTGLYRWWGTRLDGTPGLLYVGISDQPVARLSQHQQDGKHWTLRVTGSTVQWYPNREMALAAEERAIKTERPEANIIHAGRRRRLAA